MKAVMSLIGVLILLAVAACGGGGATLAGPEDSTASYTGVIEGYITQSDVARGTSSVGDGIPGVEVWCEEPGTGQRLGQDTTGSDGHYRMEGLPEGEPLLLKFQYQLAMQNGDDNQRVIEGAQQVRLETRQQLRVDAGICQYDDDGDGTPDDVGCDNEQLQVRMQTRQQEQSGGEDASGAMNQNGNMGDGNGSSQQMQQNGNMGAGSGSEDCDGDPDQTMDQQRDQLRDGTGDGSGSEDCDGDPDQTMDQQRDRMRDGEGNGNQSE